MIPAEAGADGEFAEADFVLDEGGLFEVGLVAGEGVGLRRVGIEVVGIGDEVVELFVEEGVVGLDADFDFVALFVDGDGAFEIALAEIVVLEGDDGRGERIGVEIVGVVADHAAEIADDVGIEDVLIGDDAHRLEVVAVLELAGGLLELFVGDFVARDFVADAEADAVAIGEVAFVADGEVAGGAFVGEVLRDDGVEVVAGHVAAGGDAEGVLVPLILTGGEACGGVVAAAAEDDFAVEAVAEVVRGVGFDDAAHFAAVFGGEVGGEDAERTDVVGFDFGAEAGGAIVLEGDAVDDDLGLVFGAAGVEDGVAFVDPAGLGVDEVLEGAAGEGVFAVFNLLGADAVDAAGAVGVDEGGGVVDLDGAAGGGDGEFGGEVGGGGGADFDGFGEGGEAVAGD